MQDCWYTSFVQLNIPGNRCMASGKKMDGAVSDLIIMLIGTFVSLLLLARGN
jgi:hypothetical protein